MRSHDLEVTESARLFGDTHILWMTMPPGMQSAIPGQFLMTYVGEHTDPLLGRAFSVHRRRTTERGEEFAIHFDIVEIGRAHV